MEPSVGCRLAGKAPGKTVLNISLWTTDDKNVWHVIQLNAYVYQNCFCKFGKQAGSFLSRSIADPDLGRFSIGLGLYMCYTFYKQAYAASMTFSINVWPATEYSKPDSTSTPTPTPHPRLRSVPSRSVRLYTASASWCYMNWCNVWLTQTSLSSTLLKSHMLTLVIVHDSIFQLIMPPFMHCEALTTMKMAARATTVYARDSKHQSNHRGTKLGEGNQIIK